MSGDSFQGARRRLSRRSLKRLLQLSLALALIASLLLPGVAQAGNDDSDTYTVRRGDTLSEIALYFDVPLDELMRVNGISNPNQIYVGQVLRIPSGDSGSSCVDYHTVAWGETLSSIALWYGIDEWDLAEANGIYDLNEVYQGESLCIPGYGSGGEKHHDDYDDYDHQGTGGPEHPENQPSANHDGNGPEQPHEPSGKPENHGQGGQDRPSEQPSANHGNQEQQGGQNQQGNNNSDNHEHDGEQNHQGGQNQQGNGNNSDNHGHDGEQNHQGGQNQQGNDNNSDNHGHDDEQNHQGGQNHQGNDNNSDDQGHHGEQNHQGNGNGNDSYDYDDHDHQGDQSHQGNQGQGGPDHHDGKQTPGGPVDYWLGKYYKDKYFSEFVEERQDPDIHFNWYTGKPGDNLPEDRFSIHWERWVYFQEGNYRFVAVADDGVRVIVDDQTIIDGWKIQPATEYKSDTYLREGWYKVTVDYYEEAEDAQIHVYWEKKHENR